MAKTKKMMLTSAVVTNVTTSSPSPTIDDDEDVAQRAACGADAEKWRRFCASECGAILSQASFPVAGSVEMHPAEQNFSLAIAIFTYNEHPEQVLVMGGCGWLVDVVVVVFDFVVVVVVDFVVFDFVVVDFVVIVVVVFNLIVVVVIVVVVVVVIVVVFVAVLDVVVVVGVYQTVTSFYAGVSSFAKRVSTVEFLLHSR